MLAEERNKDKKDTHYLQGHGYLKGGEDRNEAEESPRGGSSRQSMLYFFKMQSEANTAKCKCLINEDSRTQATQNSQTQVTVREFQSSCVLPGGEHTRAHLSLPLFIHEMGAPGHSWAGGI